MQALSDALQSGILSRQAVGIALILTVVLLILKHRSLAGEIVGDPARGWRAIAWLAAAAVAVSLAWITVFDDWLQLIVEPYRHTLRWGYQRVQYDPVDPAVRAVTIALAVTAILLLGLLVARHVAGYVFQVGGLLVAVLAWIPVFILNQRLTALILQGLSDDASPGEVIGLTAFWVVRLVFAALAVGVSIAAATLVVSLVASIVLDLARAREPRTTGEADAFFSSLQSRAEETPDRPIRSFWRAIERPL